MIAIVAYFAFVDRPGDIWWLDSMERQLIQAASQKTPSHATVANNPRAEALRDRKVYLFAVLSFAINFGSYALSFWLPTITQDLGIRGAQQIGLYSLILYTIGRCHGLVSAPL